MKNLLLGSLLAGLLGLLVFGLSASNTKLGGTTNLDRLDLSDGLTVGSSGSTVTQMLTGTCNLSGPSAGISASSTAIYQCAVTGAGTSDKVFVSLPKSANVNAANNNVSFANGAGLLVTGAAFASTTGVIGVEISNFGSATTSFTQATTGVQYWLVR